MRHSVRCVGGLADDPVCPRVDGVQSISAAARQVGRVEESAVAGHAGTMGAGHRDIGNFHINRRHIQW